MPRRDLLHAVPRIHYLREQWISRASALASPGTLTYKTSIEATQRSRVGIPRLPRRPHTRTRQRELLGLRSNDQKQSDDCADPSHEEVTVCQHRRTGAPAGRILGLVL